MIGIGQYRGDATPLQGVKHDMVSATQMAEQMQVPRENLIVLRDSQATKTAVMAALKNLRDRVQLGDRVFIYFSGHGTQLSEARTCQQALMTYDMQAISNREMADFTTQISEKADKVIVMLDACFSGGVLVGRSVRLKDSEALAAKFYVDSRGKGVCSDPINEVSRGLLAQVERLGIHSENFIQIAASRPDEVSWDHPAKGGVATVAVRDCLSDGSIDKNQSGAIDLEEIRACAQRKMNKFMEPFRPQGKFSSTLQVLGNKNVIVNPTQVAIAPPVAAPVVVVVQAPLPPAPSLPPVASPPPAAPPVVVSQPSLPTPTAVPSQTMPSPAETAKPPVASLPSPLPPAATPIPTRPPAQQPAETPPPAAPVVVALPTPPKPPVQTPPAAPATPAPPVAMPQPPPAAELVADGPVGSLATLKDIFAQRDPRRKLDVKLPTQLTIGKQGEFKFSVTSSVAGYLYVVLLGSDEKSFYLLFPNRIDAKNQIKAGMTYQFPTEGWDMTAGGPPGTDHILFVASEAAFDQRVFSTTDDQSVGLFAFVVGSHATRKRLVEFFLGRGIQGRSSPFAAQLLQVEERTNGR
ncbi:MAG: caspase family protein [Betaproteobacteria bacterium]